MLLEHLSDDGFIFVYMNRYIFLNYFSLLLSPIPSRLSGHIISWSHYHCPWIQSNFNKVIRSSLPFCFCLNILLMITSKVGVDVLSCSREIRIVRRNSLLLMSCLRVTQVAKVMDIFSRH